MPGFFRQLALQRRRQLQFVEAEHREGKYDEDQRETAEHPGVLQGCREQRSGQPGGDAGGGVGHRHAENVGERQCEATGVGIAVTLTGDDAGEDGDHRQHAGGQRQAEASDEEKGEIGPEPGITEDAGDFAAFVDVDPGASCCFCGRGGRGRRIGQRDGHRLRLRRVADAGIGATLRGDIELERERARGIALDWQADGDAVVENLDLTEILVVLHLALGENRTAEGDCFAFDGEAELVAVEVIALGDGEGDLDGLRVESARAGLKGDGRVEEFIGVGERNEQGKEQEQAAHDHWSVSSTTQFR